MKANLSLPLDHIDRLVNEVMKGGKYHNISEAFIQRIASQELTKQRGARSTVKAIKRKLHQVGGAFFDRPIDFDHCLGELKAALSMGQDEFRRACFEGMCYHSSARERLPEIEFFFHTILADLPPIRRVLDVACGLNPLAIPWMDLPVDVEYIAVDIYSDLIAFLNSFWSLVGVDGEAVVSDVIGNCPNYQADVVFLLKSIPCLEQVDKTAGLKLLDGIQAEHIFVSFPVNSLGGRRDRGMLKNYFNRFTQLLSDRPWKMEKFEFDTELVFLVRK